LMNLRWLYSISAEDQASWRYSAHLPSRMRTRQQQHILLVADVSED
jgi:hypothetical protein